MKKIILMAVAFLAILGSCTKEDNAKPAKPHVYPIYYNSHKVSSIIGTNKVWGDFKFVVNYSKANLLENSIRVNNQMDSLGSLTVERSKTFTVDTYRVNDIAIGASKESIDRLDAELLAKYGEGNYSLQDSIPKVSNTRYEVANSYLSDGRSLKVTEKYYKPREVLGLTDKDFKSYFPLKKTVTNFYEYNDNGRVVINRVFEDEHYDIEDPKLYNRKVSKYEMTYDNDKIISCTKFELIAGENYSVVENYIYTYSNNKLASIIGDKSYKKMFEYSGDKLKITENGHVSNYTLTSFGYPSMIDDGEGNVMKIEYTEGHSQFDFLTSTYDKIFGNPYIR